MSFITGHAEQSSKSDHRFDTPYCFLGAGRLIGVLWKKPLSEFDCRYRFSICCGPANGDESSQFLEPSDLKYLVKLTQVTASVIADDGCISDLQRREIRELAAELDVLTSRWDEFDSDNQLEPLVQSGAS